MFSCSTIGFGGDAGPVDEEAGTGPTTIGIRTEAGMAVNGVDEGFPELGGGGDACGGDAALPEGAFKVEVAGGEEPAEGECRGGGGEKCDMVTGSVFTMGCAGGAGGISEDDVEAAGGKVGLVVLNASGAEVKGGGNGAFLASPFTLRLRGGSSGTAFPFFPLSFTSLPPGPMTVPLRASSSSNDCSWASSMPHSAPLPFSSFPRASFLNPGFDERLWRTELYEP